MSEQVSTQALVLEMRDLSEFHGRNYRQPYTADVIARGADEIERLQAERDRLRDALEEMVNEARDGEDIHRSTLKLAIEALEGTK